MRGGFLRFVVWFGGIGGAIILLLYLFLYDTWVIPTDVVLDDSIMPTLYPQDRIVTSRNSGADLKVGQLARCASPEPGLEYVIGRVMGREGDKVEIRDGRVLTNGSGLPSRHACESVKVQHPATGEDVTLHCHVEENGSWTFSFLWSQNYNEGQMAANVEAGKVFLVSDNRYIHKDSRDFGQLDATSCEHIVFRLWGDSFIDSKRRFSLLY